MLIVLEQVLILVFSAAAGYALCKAGKLDSAHARTLSALQVYIFLPCTLFNTYSTHFTIPYIREKYTLLLTSFVMLLFMVVLGVVLARVVTKQPYLRSVYRYSLTVSNYGGFGYPLISALYGSLMLQNCMLFSIPISLYTYTAGYAELTKTGFSLKRLLNPVMTAILLGAAVGLTGLKLPAFVTGVVSKFAACMAPVGMLTVGMVVSEFDLLRLLKNKKNYLIIALRLLVIPCAAVGILKLLKLEECVIPALMMYAMPCGMNTIIFPRLVGEDCETGAALTLISSVLACLTIPFCFGLFT
jgi:predicted permease